MTFLGLWKAEPDERLVPLAYEPTYEKADTQKVSASRNLVAGTGFEPMTFGL